MPIEGLPQSTEGNAQQGTAGDAGKQTSSAQQQTQTANTSDATAQNTGANANTGAGTDTAQQTQAQTETERKFSQADVDRIVQSRIKSGIKAELKKLTGDGEVTIEDLQRQLSEERTERQKLMARQTVRDYLGDAKHKLNIPADAISEVEELVSTRLEYDDTGKPSNLKETVEALRSRLPRLFANSPSNINAGAGRNAAAGPTNMNDVIRQMAAGKYSGN